jgi:hypothetical protein
MWIDVKENLPAAYLGGNLVSFLNQGAQEQPLYDT